MRRGIAGMAVALGAAVAMVPFGAGTASATAGFVPTAASSAVPGCDATGIQAVGDLDGDAVAEIVVGLPEYPGGGAVDVRRTKGGGIVVTPASLGLTGATVSTRFGQSVLVTELNGDRCADLVIGAPRLGATGAVVIALGNPTGWSASEVTAVPTPTRKAGADFGWGLALGHDGSVPFLAIGMPGYPVAGLSDAGAVVKVPVPGGVPGTAVVATEDTPEVQGVAGAWDRFGEILATSGSTILAGIPHDVVNGRTGAGSVRVLQHHAGAWSGVTFSEDTVGIPGVAEKNDGFGAAVVAGAVVPQSGSSSLQFSVGVPGEDIGTVKEAGSVVSVRVGTGSTRAVVLHQDGTWLGTAVPDVGEVGDGFGESLATVRSANDTWALVVGVPGEDVGSATNAGQLVTFDFGAEMNGTMSVVTEASALFRGYVESGDHFGSTLASGSYDIDVPGDPFTSRSRLLVGIVGEDVRSAGNAGAVAWSDERNRGGAVTFSQGERSALSYGSVLATPAG